MNPMMRLLMVALTVGCGGPESTDDDPCEATSVEAYALGSEVVGCVGANANVHAYEVTAPDDRTGGYVHGSVIGAGSARVIVYEGAGITELARFEPRGEDLSFFLAIAPGRPYRVAVTNDGAVKEPSVYSFTARYVPVPDGFEPNDTLEAATPMTIGTAVQAYLFAGRQGMGIVSTAYDDYYRFGTPAGSVTITIEDVPPDLAPRLTLYGSDGTEFARVSTGLKGGPVVLKSLMPPGPAHAVLRVAPWSDAPPSTGRGVALPEHFTRPYKLTITQP